MPISRRAIEEGTKILQALLTQPERYGLTAHLIVSGYSSGGNLALNAVLNILQSPQTKSLAKKISTLIALSPWTDASLETYHTCPYQAQQQADRMCNAAILEALKLWALPAGATGKEPHISPIYRPLEQFKGMPKTTIMVGEVDGILGDSIQMIQVLKAAGVPNDLIVLKGQSHNHSSHAALQEDVFTADLIAQIIIKKY